MKVLFSALALLAIPALSEAANINQGDVEVGGLASLTQTWSGNSDSTTIQVGAAAQYFLANHFSVGAELNYAHSGSFNFYSVAPAASYYFAVQDQMAPYVTLKPLEISDSDMSRMNLSSSLRLGVKFFLTDSVAFGPALNYEHTWNTNRSRTVDSLSLLAQFAIHL